MGVGLFVFLPTALGFGWVGCLRGAFFRLPTALGYAWIFACAALVCLYACGVGLSLNSYWSISVAPVRGGTYFLCRRKER
jgi:hypothetical protein